MCGHTGRTGDRETSVRRQPRECDPQSPSSPLGARAFAERYRPESSTPPVEDWSSLPPATPLQPQDGGDSPAQPGMEYRSVMNLHLRAGVEHRRSRYRIETLGPRLLVQSLNRPFCL